MTARDMTFTDAERLARATGGAASTLEMDEEAFRAFYDRTARSVWAYLAKASGDAQAADDLLQEAYYRLIRSGAHLESESHRRHYLFRVATNLVNDRYRRRRRREEPLDETVADQATAPAEQAERLERGRRLDAAMARLKPRERELLWLAYAEGSTHAEIASILDVRARSIRVMLFRARRRLARLLGEPTRKEGGRP